MIRKPETIRKKEEGFIKIEEDEDDPERKYQKISKERIPDASKEKENLTRYPETTTKDEKSIKSEEAKDEIIKQYANIIKILEEKLHNMEKEIDILTKNPIIIKKEGENFANAEEDKNDPKSKDKKIIEQERISSYTNIESINASKNPEIIKNKYETFTNIEGGKGDTLITYEKMIKNLENKLYDIEKEKEKLAAENKYLFNKNLNEKPADFESLKEELKKNKEELLKEKNIRSIENENYKKGREEILVLKNLYINEQKDKELLRENLLKEINSLCELRDAQLATLNKQNNELVKLKNTNITLNSELIKRDQLLAQLSLNNRVLEEKFKAASNELNNKIKQYDNESLANKKIIAEERENFSYQLNNEKEKSRKEVKILSVEIEKLNERIKYLNIEFQKAQKQRDDYQNNLLSMRSLKLKLESEQLEQKQENQRLLCIIQEKTSEIKGLKEFNEYLIKPKHGKNIIGERNMNYEVLELEAARVAEENQNLKNQLFLNNKIVKAMTSRTLNNEQKNTNCMLSLKNLYRISKRYYYLKKCYFQERETRLVEHHKSIFSLIREIERQNFISAPYDSSFFLYLIIFLLIAIFIISAYRSFIIS